jgi:carbon starvation protein CstA
MTTASFFWTIYMIYVYLIVRFVFIKKLFLLLDNQSSSSTSEHKSEWLFFNLTLMMDKAFRFVEIVDSKFIGLLVFLICNVITGLINLSMNTHSETDSAAIYIMSIYVLLSFLLPFGLKFFFYVYN